VYGHGCLLSFRGNLVVIYTLSNMIVLWRKPFIQKFFRKMEWRWETQKKSEERELVKDKWYNQMGQVGTSWSRGTSVTRRGGSSDLSATSGTRRRGSWDLRGTSGTRTRGLSTWTIPLVPNGATRPWNSSTNVYVSYEHNENWFFTYIGSYTLIGSYMSAFMYAPGHHWPDISKMQPLDLDHGLSEGTGVV